jgi:hypothetical protein
MALGIIRDIIRDTACQINLPDCPGKPAVNAKISLFRIFRGIIRDIICDTACIRNLPDCRGNGQKSRIL